MARRLGARYVQRRAVSDLHREQYEEVMRSSACTLHLLEIYVQTRKIRQFTLHTEAHRQWLCTLVSDTTSVRASAATMTEAIEAAIQRFEGMSKQPGENRV